MKCGSIIFATDQGLGYLARDFYRHGIITHPLILRHGRRPDHPEWYEPGTPICYDLNNVGMLEAFCREMDVMFFFETPFVWPLLTFCREHGVKTVLMPNHECMPDPLPEHPDHYICPSLLDLKWYSELDKSAPPATFLSVPVDVPWRQRTKAEVFVHHSGNGGLRGRNGTPELVEAWQYIKSPVELLIRSQVGTHSDQWMKRNEAGGRVQYVVSNQPFETLWDEGDVFVFPEKFNGLSLPMQEAFAAGMLVMGTDRFPMNRWLPKEPLIFARGSRRARVAARCREFDEAIVEPQEIARTIDEWYGADITAYSLQGKAWAEEHSWEKLGPKYKSLLEELCE